MLSGIPSSTIDLTKNYHATIRGISHNVRFDNRSHVIGRQRAWIRCSKTGACKNHTACFRYTTVDLFESEELCVATLAAWADGGIRMPSPFTKSDHKRYEPPVEEVSLVLPVIVDGDSLWIRVGC